MVRNHFICVKPYNGYIYAMAFGIKNAFSKIDESTHNMINLFSKDTYIKKEVAPIMEILFYRDKLLLIDKGGKKLIFFDESSQQYEYYDLGLKVYTDDRQQFSCCAINRDILYVFSAYDDMVISFDLINKKKIKSINFLGGVKTTNQNPYFIYAHQEKQYVWLVGADTNTIYQYDMETEKYDLYQFECDENFINAAYDNNQFYLLSERGKLYTYSVGAPIKAFSVKGDYKLNNEKSMVYAMAVTHDNVYLLPSIGEKIYRVSLHTGISNEVTELPSDYSYHISIKGMFKFHLYSQTGGKYYFASPTTEYLLIIDKNKDELEWIKPNIDRQNDTKSIIEVYGADGMLEEFEGGLEGFISYIANDL